MRPSARCLREKAGSILHGARQEKEVTFMLPAINRPPCDTCEDEGVCMGMLSGPGGIPREGLMYCPDCDESHGGQAVPE